MAVLERSELERSPLADLHAIASELGIEGFRRLRKDDLIAAILGQAGEGGTAAAAGEEAGAAAADGETEEARPARRARRSRARRPRDAGEDDGGERRRGREERARRPRVAVEEVDEAEPEAESAEAEPAAAEETRTGVLDVLPNGSGFLRADAFRQSAEDVYVSPAQIKRCELRPGDELGGPARPPRRSERHPSLVRVETVNGQPAEPPVERPRFEELTPVFATERLSAPEGLEQAPFGKGSRVAVVDPPGSEAAPLLRRLTATLAERHPEIDVVVVLLGARPEDATEWRRTEGVTVAGGSFEHDVADHVTAAEIAVERAKRAVERGGDAAVVIAGLDAAPAAAARRLFAAARRAEESGSLTVIATTGLSGELARLATTRIVLDPGTGAQGDGMPAVSASSDTTRGDLLA